ncbi:ATP-binding protein [Curtobacterium sp. PhB136]|uniref:AAA family ATPase n=1 Tax=Curtobacterium sp. PhB136 TaxID=2485181 RepID=UPI001052F293|nr:ATP-binding protein [Curtobacterium sp. PhB136]TCK58324.1 ATPase family protein associated with various cellular activities (AAA) [Curtobacterium sp. PhB136]
MSPSKDRTYHADLEQSVIDLVRVGAGGHAAGVRQLAGRLIRTVPDGVPDANAFRAAVHKALSASQPATGLRFDSGAIPADAEGSHRLAHVDSSPDGDELIVSARVTAELRELVAERKRADELARMGISLSRTVLLSGAPGVGKTLASRWLAQRLDLPLVTLDLASVVSSYLGSSGRNIRSVLDYAKSGPCVLLLDEFDAVAKRRDDDSDIGELKRIVNVILVELDRWPETSLLVAATNHPQLLDAAIDRRFDRVIEFPLPDENERRALLRQANTCGVSEATLNLTAALWEGASHAVIMRFWEGCRRRAVLNDISFDEAITAECVAQFPTASLRGEVWRHAHVQIGMSNRRIAGLAGVSHPTVAAGIRHAGAFDD